MPGADRLGTTEREHTREDLSGPLAGHLAINELNVLPPRQVLDLVHDRCHRVEPDSVVGSMQSDQIVI